MAGARSEREHKQKTGQFDRDETFRPDKRAPRASEQREEPNKRPPKASEPRGELSAMSESMPVFPGSAHRELMTLPTHVAVPPPLVTLPEYLPYEMAPLQERVKYWGLGWPRSQAQQSQDNHKAAI